MNLNQLSRRITQSTWGIESLRWCWGGGGGDDDDDTRKETLGKTNSTVDVNDQSYDASHDNQQQSLVWGRKIIPIGFGISKLVLQCVVDSNSLLEDLCDRILEKEGGGDDEEE